MSPSCCRRVLSEICPVLVRNDGSASQLLERLSHRRAIDVCVAGNFFLPLSLLLHCWLPGTLLTPLHRYTFQGDLVFEKDATFTGCFNDNLEFGSGPGGKCGCEHGQPVAIYFILTCALWLRVEEHDHCRTMGIAFHEKNSM